MITLSAYRADEEPWRIDRLWKLYKAASQEFPALQKHIHTLHDHKGDLGVQWSTDCQADFLTKQSEKFFEEMWSDLDGGPVTFWKYGD